MFFFAYLFERLMLSRKTDFVVAVAALVQVEVRPRRDSDSRLLM